MPSVYIKTYGCQMNERDSEAVAAQLVARGYTLAPSEAAADVVLLNTCSVRDGAEQKAIGKMTALAGDLRRSRPNVILGFMGCMAQSRGQELIDRLPDVDLVVGTQKFHRAPEYLDELLAGRREKIVDIAAEAGSEASIREHLLNGRGPKSVTAFVSIMQGCNQYCTFCIVPYTRGEERSRTIPDIVAECRQLVVAGVKEITLLGQIVTSYGKRDIPVKSGKSAFVQLVESAHIPVQSGSDRILKAMHRGYTRERYIEVIRKLRAVQPEMGITSDLIVGFPGETEADFEETLSLVREASFDNAFIFKYSPRRDTPAADMPNQVPQGVREERNARLLASVNEQGARKYQSCVGKTVEILVEGPSKKNLARMMGRTRANKIVVFDGSERHRGQVMDVRVTRAGSFTLYGDPAIINLDA